MDKEKFYKVLDKLILPLFTGSSFVGEEESSPRDAEVALGKQNTLLLKLNKNDDYRIAIKRGRPFQQFEVNLLRIALKELNDIYELHLQDANYEQVLQQKAIEKAIPVTCTIMSLEEAKNSGAHGTFTDKYGSQVKVYTIGNVSKEICGGPHAENTKELHHFKIIKEESSSSGIRRIKAILD